jgi:hypothetical protein|tara:strand:+ start:453 stop:692 length:240 start_codon:yes stop_codon:yes gene_type:complete
MNAKIRGIEVEIRKIHAFNNPNGNIKVIADPIIETIHGQRFWVTEEPTNEHEWASRGLTFSSNAPQLEDYTCAYWTPDN